MPSPKMSDELVLAGLGYKQEFKRHFGWLELVGLSFSIMCVVPSLSAVLVYSIPYGGPVSMIWGWLIASIFIVFIGLAMAELGSAQPTCGGLYYWTYVYSSDRYRNVLSWLVGYINTVGYISAMSGATYAFSLLVLSAATIGSGGAFTPTTAQIYALMVATLIALALIASVATKIMARMQLFFVLMNFSLFLGIIIALPLATPAEFKNSPGFVFGSFQNLSRWPDGFAFILSFLAPTWVVSVLDSSVHISEEAKNANVAVPWAIILSVVFSATLGWVANIVIAFHMGPNLEEIISDPVGQPMATILLHAFGQKGMLVFWFFVIITFAAGSMDALTAASRQLFAFSRDGAVPMSRFLYRLNRHTGTPVNCVVFSAFGGALLGLLVFVSPAAIGAVFTLMVICQYVTYSVPIVARFVGGKEFVPGPFTLGAWGGPVAFVAATFTIFMSIVFFFPSEPGPLVDEMNYGVVLFMGIVALSMVYYFFPVYGGRYWFNGPVLTIGANSSGHNIRNHSSEKGVEGVNTKVVDQ
ncbi:APC amino acid permease [Hymenopellis radicata]|nr:APC amino acid permease [Hymenopellis radicata]